MVYWDSDEARVVASSRSRNKVWRLVQEVFSEYDVFLERHGRGCPSDDDFERYLQFAKCAVAGRGFVEGYYAGLAVANRHLPLSRCNGLHVPRQELRCETAGGISLPLKPFFGDCRVLASGTRKQPQSRTCG